jgi:hypothetical protein
MGTQKTQTFFQESMAKRSDVIGLIFRVSARGRSLLMSGVLTLILSCISWLGWAPPAQALTQLQISDVFSQDCPADIGWGAVTSGGFTQPAHCFLVHGIVHNSTNKTVYDADVYGRIYDANGESVFENRTRVGSIAEVPPGDQSFEIRISIPANQPGPLQLKQFKAAGFSSSVKAHF